MSKDLVSHVDALADLMERYRLGEAELAGGDWRIAFKRRSTVAVTTVATATEAHAEPSEYHEEVAEPVEAAPVGLPVSSPMTGIYYGAQSPSAPPFVKEGEVVNAGQVVALIEAMKVFNEIVAPVTGTVRKVLAQSGQIVAPGDPLMYIG